MLVLLAGLCGPAKASHIVGGEITYKCLGPGPVGFNRYEIRLDIYQDCREGEPDAIAQDNPAFLQIFDGNGDSFRLDTLFMETSILVPPNFSNSCVNNALPTCVKKGTFRKTYNLPINSTGYIVTYQRCCRNASIINIANPSFVGASYFAIIPPPSLSPICNNSAVFNNYPPQIICMHDPLFYDHSAIDPDGDSLSYEFCDAFIGGEQTNAKPIPEPPPYAPVNYIGGFSAEKPMAGNPLIQIGETSGLITGTPNLTGRFVVTVCCHEWRNGVNINTVKREFQFLVQDCSKAVVANIPQYSDEFNTYIVECHGNTVHFDNLSTGGFEYSWDFGVHGITSDTSNEFQPTYTYPDTGTYVVKLVVNRGSTCPDSITRFVKVYPTFSGYYNYDGLHCPNSPIMFRDSSESTLSLTDHWEWSFGDGATADIANPVHSYAQGGTYDVTLISSNPLGCADTVQKEVFIEDFRPFAANDTIIVKGEVINFRASGGLYYTWMPATNLSDPNIADPVGSYPDTGKFKYIVHIRSENDCEGDDTFTVWVVNQSAVFVPSAFSPNGDGLNDVLRPFGIGYRNINYFRVFNRWGQQVFYTTKFKEGWNGTFHGLPADIGTYYWVLNMVNRFGKDEVVKGDAVLLR